MISRVHPFTCQRQLSIYLIGYVPHGSHEEFGLAECACEDETALNAGDASFRQGPRQRGIQSAAHPHVLATSAEARLGISELREDMAALL